MASGMDGSTSNGWTMPILNLVFYILNTVITFVSITGAFGKTNSELSEKYQTLVTPDGYAFSIWGLIFTAEGIFCLVQLFYAPVRDSDILSQGVSFWWIASCVAQCAWTFAFAQEVIWLACIFMACIWIALGMILYNTFSMKYSTTEFWSSVAPFQLHFGWITAALVVNIDVLIIKSIGCYKGNYTQGCSMDDVATQIGAAVVFLAIIFAFGLYMSGVLSRPNSISTGVLSWAVIAVNSQLNNLSDDTPQYYASLGLGAKQITEGLGQANLTIGIILAIGVLINILSLCGLSPKFDFRGKGTAEIENTTFVP